MQYNFDTIENDNASAHDYTLGFGKYKGSTLNTLASDYDGRHYLIYLSTSSISQDVIDKIQMVIDSTPHITPSLAQCSLIKIRFGQYKNMTLQEVVLQPKGMEYLKYIATWDKCDHSLKDAIDVIQQDYAMQLSSR